MGEPADQASLLLASAPAGAGLQGTECRARAVPGSTARWSRKPPASAGSSRWSCSRCRASALLFLWLAFGGSVPLKPQDYRVQVDFPEATTLAEEADVRIAGVNVGKVKTKELDKGGDAHERRARDRPAVRADPEGHAGDPAAEDAARRDLRGARRRATRRGRCCRTAGTLPNAQVEPTVELDEIFSLFDEPTRTAFQDWVQELAKTIDGRPRPGPERRVRQPRRASRPTARAAPGARRAGAWRCAG